MALTVPAPSFWQESVYTPILQSPQPLQAEWLLSDAKSYVWEVTDSGHKKPVNICFDILLSDGRQLSEANPELIATIQRLTFFLRSGPFASLDTGKAQADAATNLVTLAAWMMANGIFRFDELTPVDVELYKSRAAFGTGSILENDERLEWLLEKVRHDAQTAIEQDPHKSYDTVLAALLPTFPRKRKPALDHLALFKQAGISRPSCRSNIYAIAQDVADEAGLVTLFKKDYPKREEAQVTGALQLRQHLASLEHLYRHRSQLQDGLDFNPFPGSSPGQVARQIGVQAQRTATVPPLQAMTLIERCVRWVVDYAEPLLELQMLGNRQDSRFPAALQSFSLEGPAAPRLLPELVPKVGYSVSSGHERICLNQALRFLATSCATVVAALCARRAAEVGSARVGCIRRDGTGGHWLTLFIHKSMRRDTSFPVPAVVAKAVDVLERLSATARELTGTQYLLQLNKVGTNECTWITANGHPCFEFDKYLYNLGHYFDVPALEDGARWHFKPHQMRRFFAIVYIWIYELGEFGALSAYLKHFELAQTMRYVTETEVGKIVRMAKRERTALILAKAAVGGNSTRSVLAARYQVMAQKLRDRLMLRLNVVPARKFQQRLERLVDLAGVSLSAAEFGFDAFAPEQPPVDRSLIRLGEEHLAGTNLLHSVGASNVHDSIRVASAAWAH